MRSVKRNPNIAKLHGHYLFKEIYKRRSELLEKEPEAKIISLGIGDTTEPIPTHIVSGLVEGASRLGTPHGYRGYGPDQGHESLRAKIASHFYKGKIDTDEVFISDGSKCDIGRLQLLFGGGVKLAVQDPTYPAYVDTGVAVGQTGPFQTQGYEGVIYMPCTKENGFFPDLEKAKKAEIIYFCSPNNPTGAAASKEELESLVKFAKENGSIIIYDAAYSAYIRDPNIPKSIYEIDGAKEVAIELNSFSKMAGFTGVRLGYSVVPKEILYSDGSSLRADWLRIAGTFFNGPSNIAEAGAEAAMSPIGLKEIAAQTDFYLENASLLKSCLESLGYKVHGGKNAPYLWVETKGMSSWDTFNDLLYKKHIVVTPGVGFGPSGEGFIRISAFGRRENIIEAISRLKN